MSCIKNCLQLQFLNWSVIFYVSDSFFTDFQEWSRYPVSFPRDEMLALPLTRSKNCSLILAAARWSQIKWVRLRCTECPSSLWSSTAKKDCVWRRFPTLYWRITATTKSTTDAWRLELRVCSAHRCSWRSWGARGPCPSPRAAVAWLPNARPSASANLSSGLTTLPNYPRILHSMFHTSAPGAAEEASYLRGTTAPGQNASSAPIVICIFHPTNLYFTRTAHLSLNTHSRTRPILIHGDAI